MFSSVQPPHVPLLGRTAMQPQPPRPPALPPANALLSADTDPPSLAAMAAAIARNIPAMIKGQLAKMGLTIALIFALNLALGAFPTMKILRLPSQLRTLMNTAIFLTASYNSFLARSLFWILILTFGRSLVKRIRAEGWASVHNGLVTLAPAVSAAYRSIARAALGLLLGCAGMGLILANFLSRNNHFDKFAVVFLTAIALLNGLMQGPGSPLFVVVRVGSKDVARWLKRANPVRDEHIYVLLSGLVAGLLGDALLVNRTNAGYVAGPILLLLAIGWLIYLRGTPRAAR